MDWFDPMLHIFHLHLLHFYSTYTPVILFCALGSGFDLTAKVIFTES